MKLDFIIVGQGIAGTCFAFELLKKNKSFIIIDKDQSNSSSKIALGIYNPLILKWFTKPWKIDGQIKCFYNFYNELNSFLNKNLFSDIGIYRFLKTPYEQNNWLAKSSSRIHYMSSKLFSINNKGLINNKFYGLVKSSGRVDIQLLLKSFRDYCIKKNKIIEEKFNYSDLIINKNSVIFKNITANKIIFCEGYQGIKNPFFNNINLKPTKGEILNIYSERLRLKSIIHAGFSIVPIGENFYSVGATYDWDNINTSSTLESKEKIISMLDSVLKNPYKIIDQKAGIRPSTFDRRPLLGAHKNHKNLYILNGLGTRGVLLAPYLSKCLINSIYSNSTIDSEININRS